MATAQLDAPQRWSGLDPVSQPLDAGWTQRQRQRAQSPARQAEALDLRLCPVSAAGSSARFTDEESGCARVTGCQHRMCRGSLRAADTRGDLLACWARSIAHDPAEAIALFDA